MPLSKTRLQFELRYVSLDTTDEAVLWELHDAGWIDGHAIRTPAGEAKLAALDVEAQLIAERMASINKHASRGSPDERQIIKTLVTICNRERRFMSLATGPKIHIEQTIDRDKITRKLWASDADVLYVHDTRTGPAVGWFSFRFGGDDILQTVSAYEQNELCKYLMVDVAKVMSRISARIEATDASNKYWAQRAVWNNFEKTIARAMAHGRECHAHRIDAEHKICLALAAYIKDHGLAVDIWNGSTITHLPRGTSAKDIVALLRSTFDDTLRLLDASGDPVATIKLRYGSYGYDVLTALPDALSGLDSLTPLIDKQRERLTDRDQVPLARDEK